jgi:TRAP-type C4-dicarboxylate transport system permease small subunit
MKLAEQLRRREDALGIRRKPPRWARVVGIVGLVLAAIAIGLLVWVGLQIF